MNDGEGVFRSVERLLPIVHCASLDSRARRSVKRRNRGGEIGEGRVGLLQLLERHDSFLTSASGKSGTLAPFRKGGNCNCDVVARWGQTIARPSRELSSSRIAARDWVRKNAAR
jgi:hypothetical protein